MNWEGGVDLVACTEAGLAMPNVILHVARQVNTPMGSAPAGMIFWQPDPAAPPQAMGFVSTDAAVGAYFGPQIFRGTPFENAPVVTARLGVCTDYPTTVSSRLEVPGFVFEVTMTKLAAAERISRAPGGMTPFTQDVVEAVAGTVELKVNGRVVPLIIPPVGISGGPAAVYAACGFYTR